MREDQSLTKDCLPKKEAIPVRLPRPPRRGVRAFVGLIFCGAFFVAAFGLGLLLQSRGLLPDLFAAPPTEDKTADDPVCETPVQERPQEASDLQNEGGEEQANEPIAEPLPEGAIPIVKKDLAESGEVLQNLSIYSVDPSALTLPAPERTSGKDPLILILCTHSSECYSDGVCVLPPIGDAIYSTDPEDGVLAVGKTLAESLSKKGIPTLFCNVRHDEPTLRGSYLRAKESIETLLNEYPSIQYVIDLHRDGITASDGSLVACSTEADGQSFAQLLPVVGSDGDGSDAYAWKENLALALALQTRLNELCPHLCRPVSLRNSPYNQNLAPHSLLLEIGAAGNTKEEALRSAELLAKAFAGYFKGEIS